jgi:hypothetical protein
MINSFGRAARGIACAALLALGACGQPATAQSFEDFSDDVMLYVRDGQSDHPSIVLYDSKAVQANAETHNAIVELTLDFSSATSRWDYRAAIDDKLGELLKGVTARLAATHTEPQQSRRSYLLITSNPAKVAAALGGITPPAGITIATRTLNVSDLEIWRPTPLEFQDSQDEQVRHSLAQHGDDGKKPRIVDFFFYGGDQTALRTAAKRQGFHTRGVEGERTGTILSRSTAVDSKTLTAFNSQFLEWSSRYRVDYDGWEAPVAK